MGNLLLILLILFVTLAVVVTLAERYAKPVEEKDQAKFSKILLVLIGLMFIAAIFQQFVGG